VTLTAQDVAEITRLLEESNFDELYLELDGLKLSLRRGGMAVPAPSSAPPSALSAAPPPTPLAPTASRVHGPPPVPATPPAVAASEPNTFDVTAPMLGTFYRSPKPGAPPFVEVGSTVREDTIIGIIEVMKLMNTVRAGMTGRVSQILSRDGTLVEYGEVLMRVVKSD